MAVTRQQFKDLARKLTGEVFADFAQEFTVEHLSRMPDGQGGFKETWQTFATITGFVSRISGKEEISDTYLESDYMTKFSFEHVPGIENDMRIMFKGKLFNIREIKPALEVDVYTFVVAEETSAT